MQGASLTTQDTIQALSDERQQLWREAGKRKLKPAERRRLADLSARLEQLWQAQRCTDAASVVAFDRQENTVSVEEYLQGRVFDDYRDLLQIQRRGHTAHYVSAEKPIETLGEALRMVGTELVREIQFEEECAAFLTDVLHEVIAELNLLKRAHLPPLPISILPSLAHIPA